MSALAHFNMSIARSQEQRRDVREIIDHTLHANHECPLLANGYCRSCPAYIAQRHGEFYLVQQNTISFDYEREYLRATQVANRMLLPFAHISRVGIPAPTRTRITDIHPPVETANHVCPTCPLPHLAGHICPPCPEQHLQDHVCPAAAGNTDQGPLPPPVTTTQVDFNDLAVPQNVSNEIRNLLIASANAPNGTVLFRLRGALQQANLTPTAAFNALRPRTTTITTTIHVNASCPLEHNAACHLDHYPDPDPSLPPPPNSVLLDPTVAQAQVSVASRIIIDGPTGGNNTAVTRLLLSNLSRALEHHQVNDSADRASTDLPFALRWSALMHRQEELTQLPHTRPCLYHPCLFSFAHDYFNRFSPNPNRTVDAIHLLRTFLFEYGSHLSTHGYASQFVEQVHTPLRLNGGFGNVMADMYEPVPSIGQTYTIQPGSRLTIPFPRLQFDYEDNEVPRNDRSVNIEYTT